MTDLELAKTIRTYSSTAEMLEMSGNFWGVLKETADRLEAVNVERQKFLQEISKAHEVINSLLSRVWEWIPADEKPEKYKPVFLWVKLNGGAIAGWVEGMYIGDGIWSSRSLPLNGCVEVTHWMPLPEPPEEGENENAAD